MFSAYNSHFNSHSIECAYPIIKETIPASSLGYNTNNKYPEFPPLMSDGRSVTATWQPEAIINQDLIERNGIQSNWQYRKYLTENAKDIMEYNFLESSSDVGYYKRPVDLPSIQSNTYAGGKEVNGPYLFSSMTDRKRPVGYETSDLKELYLSREQLEARKIAPSIPENQDKIIGARI